jgi:hypothetical protein
MLNGLSLTCMDADRLEDAREFCLQLLAITERQDNLAFVKARLDQIQARLDSKPSAAEGAHKGGSFFIFPLPWSGADDKGRRSSCESCSCCLAREWLPH